MRPEPRFKVGERVTVNSGDMSSCGMFNGLANKDKGAYIKITAIQRERGGEYAYRFTILKSNGDYYGSCCSCFNHLNETQLGHKDEETNGTFKIGDKVRLHLKASMHHNQKGIIVGGGTNGTQWQVKFDDGDHRWYKNSSLINENTNKAEKSNTTINQETKPKNQTFMSRLISSFKLMTKSEPEKTFIQAGVTDSNGNLSEEGKELFLAYLLAQNGMQFKTDVVDAILEEQQKNKNN